MTILNKRNWWNCLLLIGVIAIGAGCQKMDKPKLGDYPQDSNPPGGPLKFFAAMDGGSVDSIRANFGIDQDVSYAAGLTGSAAQLDGSVNGFISYVSANDFGLSSSFTISFWMNITMAQKDNDHAVGVMAFANSNNFWSNFVFYIDNNTKSPSDSMDLKIHFNDVNNSDNWNFANYNFANAWPKMYDGEWHQVAFTYDASAGIGTVYRDGQQFDQKSGQSIKFENTSKLIVGGFQEAAGISSTYGDNTWMAGFPGLIDNVRLYGVALSPSEVAASFTNKE